jgi:cyanate lyase
MERVTGSQSEARCKIVLNGRGLEYQTVRSLQSEAMSQAAALSAAGVSSAVNRRSVMRRTIFMILGIFITGIWFSTPAFAEIISTAEDAIAQESYDKRKPTLDIANKAAADKGKTLESLSKSCKVMTIRIGAVLSGQAPLEKKLQECLEGQLGLSSGTLNPLNAPPVRWNIGSIYRLHEATDVYGPAIQRWMNEHFGDAIMSAISFTVEVEEGKSHGQKTMRIIYEGKALGYSDDAYWTKE